MSATCNTSILDDHLALLSINIGMFAGYRRATREQIAALGGNLPDSKAVTEGSIKVFPNEALKDFATIKRGIFRAVSAKGVKALGSRNVFAVPKDALVDIEKDIDAAAAAYQQAKNALDQQYDQLFEAHVAANPEAEAIIRSLKVDRATALSKMHFGSNVFKIVPFVREGEDEEAGVAAIVKGLGRQLYEEVAGEMAEVLESDSFAKGKVGQKALRPLKAQVAKMQGLKFLDPSVEGAIELVGQIIASLPTSGYIEGEEFDTLKRLVEVLADVDELVNAASKVKNGISAKEVLFPPAPVAPAAPAEAPAVVAVAPAPVAGVIARPAGAVRPTLPPPMVGGGAVRPAGLGLPPLPSAPRQFQPGRLF